jgi:hypothetical protein
MTVAPAPHPSFPRKDGGQEGVGPARAARLDPRVLQETPSAVLAALRGCASGPRRVPAGPRARHAQRHRHPPRLPSPSTRSFESGLRATRFPRRRLATPPLTRARRNATVSARSTRNRHRLVTPLPLREGPSTRMTKANTGMTRVAPRLPGEALDPKLVERRPRKARPRKPKTSTISQVLGVGPPPSTSPASLPSS